MFKQFVNEKFLLTKLGTVWLLQLPLFIRTALNYDPSRISIVLLSRLP